MYARESSSNKPSGGSHCGSTGSDHLVRERKQLEKAREFNVPELCLELSWRQLRKDRTTGSIYRAAPSIVTGFSSELAENPENPH